MAELNPPLGTTTPEVLLRNAGDLDRAMNSDDDTWQNRGGDELPTMKGYQKQVDSITDDVFQARDTAVEAAATLPTKQQFTELQVAYNTLAGDPENAVTEIVIPAKDFDLAVGSASYGMIASRLAGWQFTHGVDASVTKMIDLPSHWSKMRISPIWTNLVANNNFTVSMSGEIHGWSAGETFDQAPSGYAAVVSVPGTPYIAVETELSLDLTVDTSRHTTLRISRNGTSSSDTLPTAIALLAVRLTKVA
ncbi:TPA: hypothetical protein ACUI48_004095 [Klebsiella pneumoniae]|uniref:hypothetical protein n=1 Tax=Klebsiella pneumoniae complex TaxID=3390273 RepID=UPI00103409B2|nr:MULTISPECIES: hypothetical protein [Klebsiella]MBW5618992.1 hypothetical protein [Klebsiella pneumoniae]MCB3186095.1 hypothetical protein [Klebsiella pneumoniae]MCM6084553.1 hypothetical protein [Klebsiella pneumoniae]MCQ0917755.1 hypothetical protein [Klebsiella pneumoniae]MCQ3898662.1 hypothetical protein [Klebsiella variicola]